MTAAPRETPKVTRAAPGLALLMVAALAPHAVAAEPLPLSQERIDALEFLLEKKQARLELQFAALEQSILALQGQQTALASLAQLQNYG